MTSYLFPSIMPPIPLRGDLTLTQFFLHNDPFLSRYFHFYLLPCLLLPSRVGVRCCLLPKSQCFCCFFDITDSFSSDEQRARVLLSSVSSAINGPHLLSVASCSFGYHILYFSPSMDVTALWCNICPKNPCF